MKGIEYRIDEILVLEMGTRGYMNVEQEEILKRKLLKDGYEETEVYRAVKHYKEM